MEKYDKKCRPCNQNILLPYEDEFNFIVCVFNFFKRKHELFKNQRKK